MQADPAKIVGKMVRRPFARCFSESTRPVTLPRPRRSFNAQEAKDNGGVVERERGRAADVGAVYVLNAKQRFRNGYLQRSIAIRSLVILSTVPPLDELQRYKQVGCSSVASLKASLQERADGKRVALRARWERAPAYT